MDSKAKNRPKQLHLLIAVLLSIMLTLVTFVVAFYALRTKIYKSILGAKSTSLIDSNYINFDSTNPNLKYFFEPIANSVQTYSPEWLGKEVKNSINSDTLNERYDYDVNKEGPTFRIVTVGDSFAFGFLVNTSENWSEILENELNNSVKCDNINKFEIINLGYFGYDASYVATRYLKRGAKYSPDLVLWLLNPENLDNVNEYLIPALEKIRTKEGFFNQILLPTSVFELALKGAEKEYGDNLGLEFHKKAFDVFFKEFGSKLLIFTITNLSSSHKDFISNYIDLNPADYNLIKLVDFNLRPELKLEDEHPNLEGHQKIAKELFDYLLKNYLNECKTISSN